MNRICVNDRFLRFPMIGKFSNDWKFPSQKFQWLENRFYGFLCVCLAVVILPGLASGATWYVDASRPDDGGEGTSWGTAKKIIQSAVDLAVDGDTVFVSNGVYDTGGAVVPGRSLTNRVCVTNAVKLISVNGAGVTTIRGQGPLGASAVRGVYLAAGAELIGFSVTNGHTTAGGQGGGIYAAGEAAGIVRCILKGNSAYDGGGCYGGTLKSCLLVGNEAQNDGGGVYGGRLVHCTVVDNRANWNGGGCYASAVNNSIVYYNESHFWGTRSANSFNAAFEYSCTVPIPSSGTGNITNAPGIAGTYNGHLLENSDCINAGNNAYSVGIYDWDGEGRTNGTAVDMGCDEVWPTAATDDLSLSIVSVTGTNVSKGYSFEIRAAVSGRPLSLLWQFDDGDAVTNAWKVEHVLNTVGAHTITLTATNAAHSAQAQIGITVRDVQKKTWYVSSSGNDASAGTSWDTAKRSIQEAVNLAGDGDTVLVSNGIYSSGSTVTPGYSCPNRVCVTNAVTIRSVNGAEYTVIDGGDAVRGVYMANGAVLDGFTVTNGVTDAEGSHDWAYDQGGGGVFLTDGTAVSNCIVSGCHAYSDGGGCFLWNGGEVGNCHVTGNTADHFSGGINCWMAGRVNASIINNNYAEYDGGGAHLPFGGLLANCLVYNNRALVKGGGVDFYDGGVIKNCTLYGNVAETGDGDGICITISGSADNCIIWNNGDENIYNDGGAVRNTYSSDPDFIDVGEYDFQLSADSPCIDAGNNSYAPTDLSPYDLAGNARVVDGTVDMGAYEYDSALYPWLHLSVYSERGSATPGLGAHSYEDGAVITASVDYAVFANSRKYVCNGWTLEGNIPVSGSTNRLVLTLTNNATLTWLWETNVWFDSVDTVGEGTVNGSASGWYTLGGSITVTAVADSGYVFAGWLGDVPQGQSTDNPLTVVLESEPSFTAVFQRDGSSSGPIVRYVCADSPFPAAPFTTWFTAAHTIQDAVDTTKAGDTVLVTNGVYDAGGRSAPGLSLTNRVCITNAIKLQSVNGAGVTVIKGHGFVGASAVRGVFLAAGAELDGFTVTNGFTRSVAAEDADKQGGGIYAQDASSLITNCMLMGNSAMLSGGAVYGGTLWNCTVTGNSAQEEGGGVAGSVLHYCMLRENVAQYGGGGAIQSCLYHCQVITNTAGYFGGGVDTLCSLYNCLVMDNYSEFGGGIGTSCGAYSCTFYGNSAESGGGVGSATSIVNCILYENTAYSTAPNIYSADEVLFTCSPDGVTNGINGCITGNPRFEDAENDDLRLRSDSPCVNTGTNRVWMSGSSDLDGHQRVFYHTVDMGAYECQELPPPGMLHWRYAGNLAESNPDADAGWLVQLYEDVNRDSVLAGITNFSHTGQPQGGQSRDDRMLSEFTGETILRNGIGYSWSNRFENWSGISEKHIYSVVYNQDQIGLASEAAVVDTDTFVLPPFTGSPDYVLTDVANSWVPVALDFSVNSDWGTPQPSRGTHVLHPGMVVTASVDATVISGDYQYACEGWQLSGNLPAAGHTNRLAFTLTNNAALTWLWSTNCRVTTQNNGQGSITGTSGWAARESVIELTAEPAAGWTFLHWVKDGSQVSEENPLPWIVNEPVVLTAVFQETSPPDIGAVRYDGQTVQNGSVFTIPAVISAEVTDYTGVSRVDFVVNENLIFSDSQSPYQADWNITETADGNYALKIRAYDVYNNVTSKTWNVQVDLAAPTNVPVIEKPGHDALFPKSLVAVSGHINGTCDGVLLYRDSVSQAVARVNCDGAFSLSINLADGTNRLQAAAYNRGGEGPLSGVVSVEVDRSIPTAPRGLDAKGRKDGVIRLTWRSLTEPGITGYNIYRAQQAFDTTTTAECVNSELQKSSEYYDLPPTDGSWFYRVAALNRAGTMGALSSLVSCESDRTAPSASAVYTTTGTRSGDRFGPGTVTVRLELSETPSDTPSFSLQGGPQPIVVPMALETGLVYSGRFDVTSDMGTIQASADYSAWDELGNAGQTLTAGTGIVIDAEGPVLSLLRVRPDAPMKNDSVSPLEVTVSATFDEGDVPSQTPVISYALTESQPVYQQVPLSSISGNGWRGTFTLSVTAGAIAEFVTFTYSGTDVLGNVGTNIDNLCRYEVYQDNLPALDPPRQLSAHALQGGRVDLAWDPVTGNSGYAVYRRGPFDSGFVLIDTVVAGEYADTASDGTNLYAVATIRTANTDCSTGMLSSVASAVADSIPPDMPERPGLQLMSQGVALDWDDVEDAARYRIYRAAHEFSTTNDGDCIYTTALSAEFDTQPLRGASYYALLAEDAHGNASDLSGCSYTNLSLLPVSSLHVDYTNGAVWPFLTWVDANAGYIDGYHLYAGRSEEELLAFSQLFPNTTSQYTDTGYNKNERWYGIAQVDAYNGELNEGPLRTLCLPDVSYGPSRSSRIYRGIINRAHFDVVNHSDSDIENATFSVLINDDTYRSERFDVHAGETSVVAIAVGGYADLSDIQAITNYLLIEPESGMQVRLSQTNEMSVGNDMYVVELQAEGFVHGTFGKARFVFHNTGSETVELLLSREGGNQPSDEIRFDLLTENGMLLSTTPVYQHSGSSVVLAVDGNVIVRIPAGEEFVSDWTDVFVPTASPDSAVLQLVMTQFTYNRGESDEVVIPGFSKQTSVAMRYPAYYATITNVTPRSMLITTNEQPVEVSGQVLATENNKLLPYQPVKIIVDHDGFKRVETVISDEDGEWNYQFSPAKKEGGHYEVTASHPDVQDTDARETFDIQRIRISPVSGVARCPREYDQAIDVKVYTYGDIALTNVSFSFEAEDQPQGILPDHITFTPDNAVPLVAANSSATIRGILHASRRVDDRVPMVLRVHCDGPAPGMCGIVEVDARFHDGQQSVPAPYLWISPNGIQTGVAAGKSITEEIQLGNQGYATLSNVVVSLLTANDMPAPAWVLLNADSSQGDIMAGETNHLSITFAPGDDIEVTTPETPYIFKLRVEADNYDVQEIPLYLSVDNSGLGNTFFKVRDMYTGTLRRNDVIQGVADATVQLTKSEGIPVVYTFKTDENGELLATNLPCGRYTVKLSAEDHYEKYDQLTVRPGMTTARDYALQMELITYSFSVEETEIPDLYEIILKLTFETDVPAAVCVMEPASVLIPHMEVGETWDYELEIRNEGLIAATTLDLQFPRSDEYYKIERLAVVPDMLGAKQVIHVPFRMTCLKNLEEPVTRSDAAGDTGCKKYYKKVVMVYQYVCENGLAFEDRDYFIMSRRYGTNCYDKSIGGGDGDSKDDDEGNNDKEEEEEDNEGDGEGDWDDSGGGGGGGRKVTPFGPITFSIPIREEASGPKCWLTNSYMETLYEGDDLEDMKEDLACSVNYLQREYNDEAEDMFVAVPGGRASVFRQYYGKKWRWDQLSDSLTIKLDSAGRVSMIQRGEFEYIRENTAGHVAVFRHAKYRIITCDDGYRWEDGRGSWILYDFGGRCIRRGGIEGETERMEYAGTDTNKVSGIYDRNGRKVLWYDYDEAGRLESVQDLTGRAVSYVWQGENLVAVTNVLGEVTRYTYDGKGRITRAESPAGQVTLVTYDAYGNISSLTDGDGIGHHFAFDIDNSSGEMYAEIRSAEGVIKEIWYDAAGVPVRTEINGRVVRRTEYEDNKWIYTDERGGITVKEFDDAGNMTRVIYPDGTAKTMQYDRALNQVTAVTDEAGVITRYAYDDKGRLIRLVDACDTPVERVVSNIYNAEGLLERSTVYGSSESDIQTTLFTYDENGNLGSRITEEGKVFLFPAYDQLGNVLQEVDPLGNTTFYAYDAMGRLSGMSNHTGLAEYYFYDNANNMTCKCDVAGNCMFMRYDQYNRLLEKILQDGTTITITYDRDGNVIRQKDRRGYVTENLYDNYGRVVKTIGAAGMVVSNEYGNIDSPLDRVVMTGDDASQMEFMYDPMNRVVSEATCYPDGREYVVSNSYNEAGLLTAVLDWTGNTNRMQYDALGRVTDVYNPTGGSLKYSYDCRDNVTNMMDPAGRCVEYVYDGDDNMVEITFPLGQSIRYDYDAVGNCTNSITPAGRHESYVYDSLYRLVEKHAWSQGQDDSDFYSRFEYDALGNIIAYSNEVCTCTSQYDNMGRLRLRKVDFGSFTSHYSCTYNTNGQVAAVTGSDNTARSLMYDEAGRIQSMELSDWGIVTFSDYEKLQPGTIRFPSGAVLEFTYDDNRQVVEQCYVNPENVTNWYVRYTYSPEGNVLTRDLNSELTRYGYDIYGRITNVIYPDDSLDCFVWNSTYNRIAGPGSEDHAYYDDNNRMTNNAGVDCEYDSDGNMLSLSNRIDSLQLRYDSNGRLAEVRNSSDQPVAQYAYNPFGQRVRKEASGQIVYYLYDKQGLAAELDSSGQTICSYIGYPVSGMRYPFLMKRNGSYYIYLNDQNGTPLALVNADGDVVWNSESDVFGDTTVVVQSITNNIRFPGQYFDRETDLHYNGQRYYLPETGCYNRMDPVRQGINYYVYAGGDPVNSIDWLGLHRVDCVPFSQQPAVNSQKYVKRAERFKKSTKNMKRVYDAVDIVAKGAEAGLSYNEAVNVYSRAPAAMADTVIDAVSVGVATVGTVVNYVFNPKDAIIDLMTSVGEHMIIMKGAYIEQDEQTMNRYMTPLPGQIEYSCTKRRITAGTEQAYEEVFGP